MNESPQPTVILSVRDLPPNIFAMVMATGIVSLAASGAGFGWLAVALFWLNIILYLFLLTLLFLRLVRHRAELTSDLNSHAKAPGFFTIVAASCVLGSQCVLLASIYSAGFALWLIGIVFWLALSYLMLPGLMEGTTKPRPEVGLTGAWLLVVVGTQAISVLTCILVPMLSERALGSILFVALCFWLIGSMLYIWLIAQIFHRIVFLPLTPGELTPPYWINMGAMAISTLAGVNLVANSDHMALLGDLRPFIKGMTLLFWATATWWIPILLALGVWRHLVKRVSLTYEHGYWAAVFPLGMYTACTQNLVRVFELPFLHVVSALFVWIALVAWGLTFAGFLGQFRRSF